MYQYIISADSSITTRDVAEACPFKDILFLDIAEDASTEETDLMCVKMAEEIAAYTGGEAKGKTVYISTEAKAKFFKKADKVYDSITNTFEQIIGRKLNVVPNNCCPNEFTFAEKTGLQEETLEACYNKAVWMFEHLYMFVYKDYQGKVKYGNLRQMLSQGGELHIENIFDTRIPDRNEE